MPAVEVLRKSRCGPTTARLPYRAAARGWEIDTSPIPDGPDGYHLFAPASYTRREAERAIRNEYDHRR